MDELLQPAIIMEKSKWATAPKIWLSMIKSDSKRCTQTNAEGEV